MTEPTEQDLDAVMAEHAERDGVCEICGVRWPCGPWVTAREAWDDLDAPVTDQGKHQPNCTYRVIVDGTPDDCDCNQRVPIEQRPERPTDHRAQAEYWLTHAVDAYEAAQPIDAVQAKALIGIGHALLAQIPPTRDLEYPPVATDGMTAAGFNSQLKAYWERNR